MVRLIDGAEFVRVDGNAIAGPLSELLSADLTMAVVTCGPCGRSSVLATSVVELDSAGFIVLCPSCRHTLFTVVKAGDRRTMDVQGMKGLSVPV